MNLIFFKTRLITWIPLQMCCVILFFSSWNVNAASAQGSDDSIEMSQASKASALNFTETEVFCPSGHIYQLQKEPNDPDLREKFIALSDTEKQKYFESRNKILEKLLEKLDSEKAVNLIGKFGYASNKVSGFFKRFKRNRGDDPNPAESESIIGDINDTPPEVTSKLNRESLAKDQIQELLSQIETRLWSSYGVLSKITTKGKSLALTINLGLGYRNLGGLFKWSVGIGHFT